MRSLTLALVILAVFLVFGFSAAVTHAEKCVGTAATCESYPGSGSASNPDCDDQDGCSWGYDHGFCQNLGLCTYFGNQYTCISYPGCTWVEPDPLGVGWPYCGGAFDCTVLSLSLCNGYPLCYPQYACHGTATGCSSYSTASACNSQDGCAWDVCEYPGSGDWILDVGNDCVISSDVTVNGKIIVTGTGGTLTFNQVDIVADGLEIDATSFKIIFKSPFSLRI